jgi:hypothetical protein
MSLVCKTLRGQVISLEITCQRENGRWTLNLLSESRELDADPRMPSLKLNLNEVR